MVNNRPDFEGGPDQPANAAVEAAARAAGLSYAYQPVAPGYHSPEDIARFTQLLATLPRPLLAFCRSGARSARLFMAADGQPARLIVASAHRLQHARSTRANAEWLWIDSKFSTSTL